MTGLKISRVPFGSMLTYAPRGNSEKHCQSRVEKCKLKDDRVLNSGSLMSEEIAKKISDNLAGCPFYDYFNKDVTLVPIPSSALLKKDSLWVPERITTALEKHNLGTSKTLLLRHTPLQRSSTSLAENRPKAHQHYSSIGVQKLLYEPKEIVLVDDVITRGATSLGAANRLASAFPDARIRVFAVMRTISNPDDFENTYCSCTGYISLRGENTFREP